MTLRKKQEENNLRILKDLLAQPCNKKCLECDQRGPTYVDVTIGSFVCTSCGGILRGLNPPHRVKSISMTTFTAAEISFIEGRGNEWCRAIYLAKYDEQSRAKPESKSDQSKLKHFMELKYEQKRWYESPSQQRKLMESVAAAKKVKESTAAEVLPLESLLGEHVSSIQLPSTNKSASHEIKSRKDVRPSSDLLGSFNARIGMPISDTNSKPDRNASMTSKTFADFDSAFSNFSAPPVPASTSQNAFGNFCTVNSEPMAFTHAANTQAFTSDNQRQPTKSNSAKDKYAALADLDSVFNKSELQATTPSVDDFLWSSPPGSTQTSQHNMLQPSQSNLIQSQQANAFTPPLISLHKSSPFPKVPAVPVPQSWSSVPSIWNSGCQEQPELQQLGTSTSNPFFTSTTTAALLPRNVNFEYGTSAQPQQPTPVSMTNQTAMSSTNPFNVGVTSNQTEYFQPPGAKQTPGRNNPFMF